VDDSFGGMSVDVPALAHAQLDRLLEGVLGEGGQGIRSQDLKVLQLEFVPDLLGKVSDWSSGDHLK